MGSSDRLGHWRRGRCDWLGCWGRVGRRRGGRGSWRRGSCWGGRSSRMVRVDLLERSSRGLTCLWRVRSRGVVAAERRATVLAEAHVRLVAALAAIAGDVLRGRRDWCGEIDDRARQRGLRVVELRATRQTEAVHLGVERAATRTRVALTCWSLGRELEVGRRRTRTNAGRTLGSGGRGAAGAWARGD